MTDAEQKLVTPVKSSAGELQPKSGQGYLDCDLKHMEQPTELKHITQWRKDKQLRLLQ